MKNYISINELKSLIIRKRASSEILRLELQAVTGKEADVILDAYIQGEAQVLNVLQQMIDANEEENQHAA